MVARAAHLVSSIAWCTAVTGLMSGPGYGERWTPFRAQVPAMSSVPVSPSTERRLQRWDAATTLLENTVEERRRQDHRAHLARLVGVYVGDDVPGVGSEAEVPMLVGAAYRAAQVTARPAASQGS